MARSKTYSDAIALLNTCQSNAAAIEALRKSGGRLSDWAVPEMHHYLRRIGYVPDDLNKLNVLHITGTKGKGSTSAFTERILRTHLPGKIGLYTSPHLCAVRERIRINGEPISEPDFAKYFFDVWERLEADPQQLSEHTPIYPLYFRLLTLVAFHAFLSLRVSATVLEVGIGGTYDSTNIIPRPIVTGITSLGLDHTAVLGNTIEEIARNKAGIYKLNVPALTVPQESESALEILREIANKNGVSEFKVIPMIPEMELGLKGSHQLINASLAVSMSKVFLETIGEKLGAKYLNEMKEEKGIPESFKIALKETKWPGRCQTVRYKGVNWMLDGAHTIESLTSCGEWAWSVSEGKPNILIFNCSGGRSGKSLLKALLEAGARVLGKTVEEVGKGMKMIIFCANVTYSSGEFKGGEFSLLIGKTSLHF
ncbi:folylpolyglutamate synthase [Tremella mesenterica]|uniref:tetrahydrofolate synthase n=1 Tax=Tremella mesenterica TaxID=5217 RepID=A0A4Q1BFY8_TREME|nr:folylpolyglutamate synthase [Tremella mesenterica]